MWEHGVTLPRAQARTHLVGTREGESQERRRVGIRVLNDGWMCVVSRIKNR